MSAHRAVGLLGVLAASTVLGVAAGSATEPRREALDLLQQALREADAIQRDDFKGEVLREIGSAQARAGAKFAAKGTFARAALYTARSSEPSVRRAALGELAVAQDAAGDLPGAIATAMLEANLSTHFRQPAEELVDALLAKKDFTAARSVAVAVPGPDGVALLGRIAVDEWVAGDAAAADGTLRQAARRVGVTVWARSQAAESLVQAQTVLGAVAAARQTADASPHPQRKNTALENIAVGQALRGDVAGAHVTAEAITDADSRATALMKVGRAQVRRGDVSGALGTAAAIRVINVREALTRDVAVAQARRGDVVAARQTAAQIRRGFHQSSALLHILRAQLRGGDIQGALATEATIPADDVLIRIDALRDISSAQAARGDVAAAVTTAARIGRDPVLRAWAMRDIVMRQTNSGDWKGALQTAALIRDPELDYLLTGDAMREIAVRRARDGDIQGATTWAASHAAPAVRAQALLGIAEGILERAGLGTHRPLKAQGWWEPPE